MKVIISMHMLESEEKGVCPFHCWFSLFLLLGNCISPHEVLILIFNNCIFKNGKSEDFDCHLPFVDKKYRRKEWCPKVIYWNLKILEMERLIRSHILIYPLVHRWENLNTERTGQSRVRIVFMCYCTFYHEKKNTTWVSSVWFF